MTLSILDWSFITAFFIVSLVIGIMVSRQSGKSSSDFFLSGRNMPWWLLGVSMVATTFSADTPNLVTDIIRKNGVSGNWEWWAFLITGMMTVFIYAKLWRRSGILTDLEFYELRYSGKEAAFLRGFRALYLGVVFNILIMATVCLAAIKIGSTMLNLSPIQTLLIASVVTVIYSAIGGLKGIILTDFFQFIIAMIGTIWAAIVIVNLPEVGGLTELLQHENVIDKLDILPSFSDKDALISLLIIPLAVQWWAAYYPGSEPGGGGYIVQRMLAAKDEKNAIAATLFFNIAHYALRPWPWILIALASLVVFPDLNSISAAFPNVDQSVVNDDLAYSAMLTYLPNGLLGIVIASLIAAFMSTISTHLNWGSSYIVNDFYKRFIDPSVSERKMVWIGRLSTMLLMVVAAVLALFLQNAKTAFDIIVLMGAGTGLLFILRWFWWRINAYSELSAMVISFVIAIVFKFIIPGYFPNHIELLLSVAITTIGWVSVTFLTPSVDRGTLVHFYQLIKPHRMGWKPVVAQALADQVITKEEVTIGKLPRELSGMFAGIFLVYGILFTTGFWLYGNMPYAIVGTVISIISAYVLRKAWQKI
ncbi:MAG: sodium:solute symporter family protein [Lewinella sp.]|uniref:sodium:solute symporter family protein n=1 Tax=Lewinella sp. TaxID=2004506 RepID=UPI003D6C1F85